MATKMRPTISQAVAPPPLTQPTMTPMGPTRPQVPMPEAIAKPFCSRWNTQVARGPPTREAATARKPEHGLAHKVRNLKHGGTETLRRKALEAVLPPGGYGKAHHMGAAAGHTGAARKAGQPECGAYCRGADGKGKHRAHYGGDEKPHDKGAHLSRPHDKVAYNRAYLSDGRGDEHSGKHARQDCYSGGNDQIHRRAFGNQLAKKDGYNAHEENGQGTAAAAQRVAA